MVDALPPGVEMQQQYPICSQPPTLGASLDVVSSAPEYGEQVPLELSEERVQCYNYHRVATTKTSTYTYTLRRYSFHSIHTAPIRTPGHKFICSRVRPQNAVVAKRVYCAVVAKRGYCADRVFSAQVVSSAVYTAVSAGTAVWHVLCAMPSLCLWVFSRRVLQPAL